MLTFPLWYLTFLGAQSKVQAQHPPHLVLSCYALSYIHTYMISKMTLRAHNLHGSEITSHLLVKKKIILPPSRIKHSYLILTSSIILVVVLCYQILHNFWESFLFVFATGLLYYHRMYWLSLALRLPLSYLLHMETLYPTRPYYQHYHIHPHVLVLLTRSLLLITCLSNS